MKKATDLHHEAMRFVDEAEFAKRKGKTKLAAKKLQQAFDFERKAADLVAGDTTLEPTRAVLHRSAATLALKCGELREAKRLIAVALSGNPFSEYAEQLRDLLEQVYFGAKKKGRRTITKIT